MPTFIEQEGDITVKTTVKDGMLVEERTQDVEPYFDANKRYANSHDGYSKSRDLQHVATIPPIIVLKWLEEGFNIYGPHDPKDLERRLNDFTTYGKLRTGAGRL
jgi:hypothetical protein